MASKLCIFTALSALLGAALATPSAGRTDRGWILKMDPQSVTTCLEESANFLLLVTGIGEDKTNVSIGWDADEAISIQPPSIVIAGSESRNITVQVSSTQQGRFLIRPTFMPNDQIEDNGRLFVQVKVAKHRSLIIISMLIGWTYTLCWTIGDYFQAWTSYKRKSVVGLSFDFLHLNIVGNICYATFNVVLFWNEHVESEYFRRHPFGLNPVVPNDVGYAVHAVFGNLVLIAQCYIYHSGGNLVSMPVKVLMTGYLILVGIFCSLAAEQQIHWLDFLYILSYVKLSTNLIKYIPQVFMNYRRKSTEGFAISNRMLDLAGGLLSLTQMALNGWNYDDWQSIVGSPVKFGLGFVSIFFDVVFMLQHYVCYKQADLK